MSLRTTGLRAGHGATEVLGGVDLAAADGEVLAVLGPSGSGKSTLLRVVAGLHPASAGTVELDGRDVTRVPPERRGTGLVPQDGALFSHLTVAGNTAFGLRGTPGAPRGRRAAARHPRVRELLELLDLDDLSERRPHELSGGQQQRVALARALAPRPRLVLLDEPFSALDAGLRTRVRDDVVTALRAEGVGALLVTHDQEEALQVADRVAVLRAGRVVQSAPPRELWEAPRDAWTARFLGGAELLAAEPGPGRTVTTALGTLHLGSQAPAASAPAPGARLAVVVRAEQLRLVTPPAAAHAAGPATAGTVAEVRYLGHTTLVRVRLDHPAGTVVGVRLPAADPLPAVGERCGVEVRGPVHAVPVAAGGGADPQPR